MANTVKVTAARLYSELKGSSIRTTTVSAYLEFKGQTAVRVTRAGAYIEMSGSDTTVSSTATNAYVEVQGEQNAKVTRVGGYIELSPGVTTAPTNPTLPTGDTYNNVKVTDLIMLAGAQLTGILMPQFLVYAEVLDAQLRVTKFGVLPEITSKELHVTKFGVLVEIIYREPVANGVIIVGDHKTWRDHYPQTSTDIRPLEAYNFIVSANGMYMIDLEWELVEGADGYEIERSLNGTTGWTLIQVTDPEVDEYISISLNPNTTYYYRIRSFNEGGYSAYSDVISETTKKIGPSLIAKERVVNSTSQFITIPRSEDIGPGDFMLMQIGIEDADTIFIPEGWVLETTLSADNYTNLILSKIAQPNEGNTITIERAGSTKPIVTVSLFVWDGRDDNIIFFDG